MVEQVSPVLLPAFPTPSPTVGVAITLEGGAGAMLEVPAGPRSRIDPLLSTAPGTIWAMAASTLLVVSGAAWDRLATKAPPLQLLSTKPGCVMGSPTLPWSDLSSTWLLLRMNK